MNTNSFNLRKTIFAALYISIGVVLPLAFHSVPNAGVIFSPMHIPVLLCGITCGFHYGLICGITTPFLSSIITGMPPIAILPSMVCELAVYGLISGLCARYIYPKKQIINIYASLIFSMLAGRVVKGVLDALLFSADTFSLEAWMTSSFVTAIPGIIIQILVIPVAVLAVRKYGRDILYK